VKKAKKEKGRKAGGDDVREESSNVAAPRKKGGRGEEEGEEGEEEQEETPPRRDGAVERGIGNFANFSRTVYEPHKGALEFFELAHSGRGRGSSNPLVARRVFKVCRDAKGVVLLPGWMAKLEDELQ